LLIRDGEAEPWERSAIDACLEGSLGIGDLVSLELANARTDDEPDHPEQNLLQARRTKSKRGFDIHAAVGVPATDREGREGLLRYCARAPLSLERLAALPDGRIAYRIKAPRGKQTHRVTTPLQFLARLCALIPPPRHPLIRFHGVFAPHSAWRMGVVSLSGAGTDAKHDSNRAACLAQPQATAQPAVGTGPKRQPRTDIDWATLLRRVYDLDALACRCGGRLRVITLITEPAVARAILDSVGLPSQPPPVARARSPDDHDSAAE
jgi:Putative transposase